MIETTDNGRILIEFETKGLTEIEQQIDRIIEKLKMANVLVDTSAIKLNQLEINIKL